MRKGIRKQLAAIVLATVATGSVYAVAPGFYMGLMAGPATNGGSSQEAGLATPLPPQQPNIAMVSPRSNQFGSRLFLGYKMNPYAGFEGGFNFFSKIQYDTQGQQTCADASERIRDIDLVGKVTAPLGSFFDVFAKGGIAAMYITNGGAFSSESASMQNPDGTVMINPNFCKNVYTTKVAPTIGIGASYDVNQNWVLEASWIRLMAGGIIKNMDFYGLGFSYHFVDKYCGQFLCDD